MEESQYKVCVRCFTFNHAKFIEDAMNGFCIQETRFPFVCTIVDDASTDGEQEVLLNFLNTHFDLRDKSVFRNEETDDYSLIFARHKTNVNCYFAVLLLKYNHYCIKKTKFPYIARWIDNVKYHALCEGDDYWIDSQKLQRQVDFLETNPDYSMCFHRAKNVMIDNYDVGLKADDIENREYFPNELFQEWKVPTASIVAKKEHLYVKNIREERVLNGDVVIVLNCAKIGKIRGMSDVMSVYRVHAGGVTYDKQYQVLRIKKYPAHFEFIKDNYPFINRRVINHYISRAYLNRRKVQKSILLWLRDILMAFYFYPLAFLDKIVK